MKGKGTKRGEESRSAGELEKRGRNRDEERRGMESDMERVEGRITEKEKR